MRAHYPGWDVTKCRSTTSSRRSSTAGGSAQAGEPDRRAAGWRVAHHQLPVSLHSAGTSGRRASTSRRCGRASSASRSSACASQPVLRAHLRSAARRGRGPTVRRPAAPRQAHRVRRSRASLFLVMHLMIAGRLRWRERGAAIRGEARTGGLRVRRRHAALHRGRLASKRASLHVVARRGRAAALDPGGIEVARRSTPRAVRARR